MVQNDNNDASIAHSPADVFATPPCHCGGAPTRSHRVPKGWRLARRSQVQQHVEGCCLPAVQDWRSKPACSWRRTCKRRQVHRRNGNELWRMH
ncbi:hypothetical protein JG687_00017771 [Phytophthora cactorum]|uniref:Uncharacterized protein n=1 Tax=Phytophthora cactorum TaxID=29920 RepID=A0A8T1TQJ9_9STRA|nr:hypothetical protein JG687_00017771 [Phytophthora cactorum]